MEPALEGTEAEPFPEPSLWPTWEPWTKGEYALTYDPTYTETESEETETEPEPKPREPAEPSDGPGL
jgi:hypothetical protein